MGVAKSKCLSNNSKRELVNNSEESHSSARRVTHQRGESFNSKDSFSVMPISLITQPTINVAEVHRELLDAIDQGNDTDFVRLCQLITDEIELLQGLLLKCLLASHWYMTMWLLQNTAVDINHKHGNFTPLTAACLRNDTQLVKYIVQMPGIDVNITDVENRTPLFIACDNGNIDIVRFLINTPRFIVNNSGNSEDHIPLIKAVLKHRRDIVECLLRVPGIDVNVRGKDGKSALSYACLHGYSDIVSILIAADGIDVDLTDANEETPLFIACT